MVSIRGAEGYEANQRTAQALGNGQLFPFVLVLEGESVVEQRRRGGDAQATAANPNARSSSYFTTGEDLVYVSEDGNVTSPR